MLEADASEAQKNYHLSPEVDSTTQNDTPTQISGVPTTDRVCAEYRSVTLRTGTIPGQGRA